MSTATNGWEPWGVVTGDIATERLQLLHQSKEVGVLLNVVTGDIATERLQHSQAVIHRYHSTGW